MNSALRAVPINFDRVRVGIGAQRNDANVSSSYSGLTIGTPAACIAASKSRTPPAESTRTPKWNHGGTGAGAASCISASRKSRSPVMNVMSSSERLVASPNHRR